MDWQLQEAKNRFSEVVQRALRDGSQTVTLRGERTAVLLSDKDHDALTSASGTLVDHLLSGPTWDDAMVEAANARGKAPSRESL